MAIVSGPYWMIGCAGLALFLSAAPAQAMPAHVRSDIGFEIECNHRTRLYHGNEHEPMKRKQTLVDVGNGELAVEADDTLISKSRANAFYAETVQQYDASIEEAKKAESSFEIVMPARTGLPLTDEGRAQLEKLVKVLQTLVRNLNSSDPVSATTLASGVHDAIVSEPKAAVVRAEKPFCTVQATVAIPLHCLSHFIEKQSTFFAKPAVYGDMKQRLSKAHEFVEKSFSSPNAVAAVIALAAEYLDSAKNLWYPARKTTLKEMMPVVSRSDFVSLLNFLQLPPAEGKRLKDNWTQWVIRSTTQRNKESPGTALHQIKEGVESSMFVGSRKAVSVHLGFDPRSADADQHGPFFLFQKTISGWLDGLWTNHDFLTESKAPRLPPALHELLGNPYESLGTLPAKVDKYPMFEFRDIGNVSWNESELPLKLETLFNEARVLLEQCQ
jgi:hypothetical protein